MSDLSYQWTCQQYPSQTRTCEGCGHQHQVAAGVISDDQGEELAMYVASLAVHDGVRLVSLYIGLMVTDHKGRELEKNFVSQLLYMREGEVSVSVITDPHNPLAEHTMTREEALKSPFISLIFEIDGFVLEADDRIRPFLEGKGNDGPEAPNA